MIEEKAEIRGFTGKNAFLSNSYTSMIQYNGLVGYSVESLYQALKCKDSEMQKAIAGMSAAEAYKIGQSVAKREDWYEVEDGIEIRDLTMLILLYNKFTSSEELKKLLLNTGNSVLVNEVNYPDTEWGVYAGNGKGENKLGKMLMLVREKIGVEDGGFEELKQAQTEAQTMLEKGKKARFGEE
jgi:ribA/ribD-fused uncharacterized protein